MYKWKHAIFCFLFLGRRKKEVSKANHKTVSSKVPQMIRKCACRYVIFLMNDCILGK